ncbi:MAG: hypothetical protein J4F38_02705 [Pseudomonadales bacterium]|nr:hypothetical protein [Pseudomonadales bacterium]
MLEESSALLTGDTRAALLEIIAGTPLPKPTDHKGGRDTDMFEVDLPGDVVGSIVEQVDETARRGMSTPRSTRIGGFATAWRELLAYHHVPMRATTRVAPTSAGSDV